MESPPPVHGTSPLIFISHDSRDVEIAKAFRALLETVSSSTLPSFIAEGGVPYGAEWYKEIMKNVGSATDVVCLLTPHGRERPWLLYEVGLGKGRGIDVYGVALGVDGGEVPSGPFAQLQNCKGAEEPLFGLVMQLLGRRCPTLKPSPRWVKTEVQDFLKAAHAVLETQSAVKLSEPTPAATVDTMARMFEEMRHIARELPLRVESKLAESSQGQRAVDVSVVENAAFAMRSSSLDPVALLVLTSTVRENLPWLYELAVETYHDMLRDDDLGRACEVLVHFKNRLEALLDGSFLDEMNIVSTQVTAILESLRSHVRELEAAYRIEG